MASTPAASADAAADWYRSAAGLINRCNLSPLAIASHAFQQDPQPLEIAWVRQENQAFFALLGRLGDAGERAECFVEHVLARFWMHEDRTRWPSARQRRRDGYEGVLRGWGIDSNGASGAVLKGWAESRFGLRAIWHRTALSADADARERYASARMRGATAGIGMQLDLLYAFCQDELRRRHPQTRWLTLWRGTHDAEAYVIKQAGPREQLVEFDSVSSFTGDREVAWEFGSRVWEVRVPLEKVVCFGGLLPGVLQGEREHIVLGGDFLVTVLMH